MPVASLESVIVGRGGGQCVNTCQGLYELLHIYVRGSGTLRHALAVHNPVSFSSPYLQVNYVYGFMLLVFLILLIVMIT